MTPEFLRARLRACHAEAGLSWPPNHLAVALSGGADSLALALLARELGLADGFTLSTFTVDHRLRPESAAEADAMQARMAALGVAHRILIWEHEGIAGNLPAAARAARYGLLTEACSAEGIPALLLGHHADDQAETLLHQLLRGSGVDGLSAMPPARMEYGVALMRPLLATPKAALEALCQAWGQAWLEDPSNDDPRFARTLLRRLLAEFGETGLSSARLAETAAHMARARAALETMTAALLEQGAMGKGQARLPLPAWRAVPEEIRLRALRAIAVRLGAAEPPRFDSLTRLAGALLHEENGQCCLHRLIWRWADGELAVKQE